jgi:tetratricopeptide (TPR) repeat protein
MALISSVQFDGEPSSVAETVMEAKTKIWPWVFALALLAGVADVVAQEVPQDATASEREAHFRQQLLADPESPARYLGLANALVDGERAAEAVALLSSAADRWIRRGEYDKAQEALTVAVAMQPDVQSLQVRLGRAQTLNRNHQSAVRSLSRAVELNPNDPEALVYLGTALWETGQQERAEASFRASLEKQRSPVGVYQLGRLLLWQGRYPEALPLLREVAGVAPSIDSFFDLAEAQRGAGEFEDAIATYRRVLSRAPQLTKAHYGLATALRRNGDLEEAQQELQILQRLYAEDEERTRASQLQKGETGRAADLLRTDKVEEAIELLEAIPETLESLRLLAQAHLRYGNPEVAAAVLERAVGLDPGNGELRRLLAEARRLASGSDS